jgi:multidrug efflux system membrane fusion protein
MDPSPTDARPPPPPPRPPLSAGRRGLGAAIALATLIGLAALAWYLTHRPPEAAPGIGGAFAAASGASGADRGGPGGPGAGTGGGGAGAGGPGGGGRGARGAPPSAVGVAVATHADLPVVLDALGTVTPVVTVTVRPQVSGVITQVLFSEGTDRQEGQLLVTIDPRSFEIALQQAIGARQRDEAQLDSARVQLQRYQTLLGQDSIARQDVDTQAALVKQLEGTLVIDRANETRRASTSATAASSRRSPAASACAPSTPATTSAPAMPTASPSSPSWRRSTSRSRCRRTAFPKCRRASPPAAELAVAAFDRTRTKKLDDGIFMTLDNQIDVQTGTVKAKARFPNAAATCSRTSSSTRACSCARSKARSSCRSPRCGAARAATSSTSSTTTAR